MNKEELVQEITKKTKVTQKQAAEVLSNWRLEDCDLYVTLEPCPMCGWAILQSRIKNVFFGSFDNNYGAFSKVNLSEYSSFKTSIYGGICEDSCNNILKDFFKNIRK